MLRSLSIRRSPTAYSLPLPRGRRMRRGWRSSSPCWVLVSRSDTRVAICTAGNDGVSSARPRMLPSSAQPSGLCVKQDILRQDRRVGRSDVWLPSLGFGAAAIGNLYSAVTAAAAMDAVTAALNSGVYYFDTAPLYGFGLSETRLGL